MIRKIKSLICLLLACILSFACACYIFAAAGFTDVEDSYWGLSYISVAKEKHIIEGYEQKDGTWIFKPENDVSKQECVKMLCCTLWPETDTDTSAEAKSANDALIQKWSKELRTANFDTWAEKYGAIFFEKGIIEPSDFTETSGTKKGAFVPAKRELISKWTVKLMGYTITPASAAYFPDSDTISADYLQYADTLYREGIMEGSNGKFNAQKGVRRVEFAAICTRLLGLEEREKHNPYSLQWSGTLSDFNSTRNTFVVSEKSLNKDAKLSNYTVHINKDSKIVLDGIAAAFSDLEKLNGKYISVACLANSDTVVVQTTPKILKGTIAETRENTNYRSLIIKLENGTTLEYLINSETEFSGNPSAEDACTFLADGITILEMK